MMLLKTVAFSVGISCALWLAITILPSVIRVWLGRATGIGFIVPRAVQGLPKALQMPLTLLAVPVIVGIAIGCLWFYLLPL